MNTATISSITLAITTIIIGNESFFFASVFFIRFFSFVGVDPFLTIGIVNFANLYCTHIFFFYINKKCAYRSRRTKTQTPIVAKLTEIARALLIHSGICIFIKFIVCISAKGYTTPHRLIFYLFS